MSDAKTPVNNDEQAMVVNDQPSEQPSEQQMVLADAIPYPQTVSVVDMFTGRSIQLFSTIVDDGTMETKAKIYNAMNDNTAAVGDMIGSILEITDVIAYPVSFVDDDGDTINTARVVLVGMDGKSYGSVANGIAKSLQSIMAVVGPAPWPQGIKVSPMNKRTRKGFQTLTLRLVP